MRGNTTRYGPRPGLRAEILLRAAPVVLICGLLPGLVLQNLALAVALPVAAMLVLAWRCWRLDLIANHETIVVVNLCRTVRMSRREVAGT